MSLRFRIYVQQPQHKALFNKFKFFTGIYSPHIAELIEASCVTFKNNYYKHE